MPRRSVTTNLLCLTETCFSAFEDKAQVDVIYTDLKAAFDLVDHEMLLSKLRKIGASTNFTDWLRSYLCGRTLQTKLDSCTSNNFVNKSGVPQGSNLGPLLFALFINDGVLLLGNGCKLVYADDLKLFVVVRTLEDCRRLQGLLNIFVEWCTRNRMVLSIPKCVVVTFHRIQRPIAYDYSIGGTELNRCDQVKDLGVILDSGMTFNLHRDAVIKKANRQLGFISKIAKDFTDPHCLKSLFCSLVRPTLENAVLVWLPYQVSWTLRIDRIQKKFIQRALRYLPWRENQENTPYPDRCKLLQLETLERRRKITQATFIAKLLNGEVDCPELLSHINFRVPHRTLRNNTLIQPRFHRTTFGFHRPLDSMVRTFTSVEELFEFGEPSLRFVNKLKRSPSV